MLRVRTGYSFRTAAGTLENVMSRLKEVGADYAPITDRASTFGFQRWAKLAKQNGLKPIFGVELAVTESIHAKKPIVDYWTFLAIADLKYLNQLIYTATSQFRYEPLLTYEQASLAEGVIKLIGHRSQLERLVPAEDIAVLLGPAASKGYISAALAKGFRLAASSDNKFPRQEDEGFAQVLCGRGFSSHTYDQSLMGKEAWKVSAAGKVQSEAIDRSWTTAADLAALCHAMPRTATMLTPKKPQTLEAMCRAGAKIIGVDLDDQKYEDRLQRELKLIKDKDFEDYFFIIADMMVWARKRMICGPARGSSCGSLVCYLLQITTVDPLEYDLLFERFIDITRSDLPDIDLDFSDQKRHLVFEYMEQKYGKEHIARLGTVALFRPRSAIDESAGALGVPKWMTDKVVDSLIVRSGGDSRALNTLEDTFSSTAAGRELVAKYPEILVAQKMEGHPRHHSQHAAGIVVTDEPVLNYVAVDARTGATFCDKKDAEDLNLLKIDALGLTQLSVFEDALAMAGKPMHFLETVDKNDVMAFEIFNKGKFSGIFQFNGPALQSICNQITISSLDDIVAVTALGRPGPLASGGTNEWVKRKNGTSPVNFPHPIFEPFLKTTLGIVAYQEQVMQIGREIGDLSWDDVTALRKAMSKSLGKEYFDQFGDKFKAGAISKGVPPEALEKIWDDLCSYGAWCFNLSHAVAYGIISYWCAYMKAHFPFDFAAATLSHENDPKRQIQILREMAAENIDFIPVDKELSTNKWTSGTKDNKRCLIGPLQNVKGLGPKLINQILGARIRNEPLPARAEKLLSNPITELSSLWPVRDAFKKLMPDPAARNINTPPHEVIDLQVNGLEYSAMVFVVVDQIKPRDENEAVNVARRGYVLKELTQSLNMTVADDTDRIFAKIDRFRFSTLGREVIDRGRVGKAMYAMKGTVPKAFRMLRVEAIRFIGMMDDNV